MVSKIKELARERGMTIMDVERECGIGKKSIYNWDESSPGVDKVQRVANFFGVTIDDLLSSDDNNIS